jgi:hypothetical protein
LEVLGNLRNRLDARHALQAKLFLHLLKVRAHQFEDLLAREVVNGSQKQPSSALS